MPWPTRRRLTYAGSTRVRGLTQRTNADLDGRGRTTGAVSDILATDIPSILQTEKRRAAEIRLVPFSYL